MTALRYPRKSSCSVLPCRYASMLFLQYTPLQIYRDKCLPVTGDEVGQQTCVIFECGSTDGDCPPTEYPMCDG